MTDTIFENNVFDLSLVRVPCSDMEEAGFMTYTADSHQMAVEMLWLHLLCPVYDLNRHIYIF